MVKLAAAAREAGAEYLFDPGQALPALLEGAAARIAPLKEVLAAAKGIFVNDYEAAMLSKRFNLRVLLANPDHFLVRTRGAAGVDLLRDGRTSSLPPADADGVVDRTGCGDAFRAGFLHAYVRKQPLEACASLGAVMGALAVGSDGGQKHHTTRKEVYARWDAYNDMAHIECTTRLGV
jgi:adenosine kinase